MSKLDVAYRDNIFPYFSSMPGKLGELPCVNQAVSSVVFWTIFSSFGKQLID